MQIDNTNPEMIYYQLDLPFGQNQVIFINDAVINDVRRDRGTLFVTITYENRSGRGQQGGNRRQQMVLLVSRTTRIQDNFGREVAQDQLRQGTRINALVSARMTFSQPPQTQAFIIIVNARRRQNEVSEGRIVNINPRRNTFTIREGDRGQERDRDRDRGPGRDRDDDDDGRRNRIRFFIDENTRILNRAGRPVNFNFLRERDFVRVEYQRLQQGAEEQVNIASVVQLQ